MSFSAIDLYIPIMNNVNILAGIELTEKENKLVRLISGRYRTHAINGRTLYQQTVFWALYMQGTSIYLDIGTGVEGKNL